LSLPDSLDPIVIAFLVALLVLTALAGAGLAALVLRKPKSDPHLDGKLAELSQIHATLQGRLEQMAQTSQSGQEGMRKSMDERLDVVSKRVGDSLTQSQEKSTAALRHLYERLAVIDSAQKNISELTGEVTGLKQILSNKQARGAFGEVQLKDVVSGLLSPNAYEFQATLSNGKRPDALILLPDPPGPVAVDAKFPLEAYRALVDAPDEAAKLTAQRAFTADVKKHLTAISDKYLIAGETSDTALMFVPSEAVYATIHADFPELVDLGRKKRVLVVSPTTLMAILNTVRAVMRDAEMHKQAHLIQAEVGKMMRDIELLDERVGKLQRNFEIAGKAISEIRTSTDRILRKGEKIAEVELEDDDQPTALPTAKVDA
jgi:DNA recombination protein RmuC